MAATEGAEGLFHSLRRLLELPDGVEVYPGHVAGSLCGKAMSSKASSTIGFERRFNHALQLDDQVAFVAEAASVAAPKPPNMARLVELNRGPFVGAPREIEELPVAPAGATVLDVRPASDFLAGHAQGALERARLRLRLRDEGGLRARRRRVESSCRPRRTHEAERAIRGLQAVGFLDLEGYVLGEGPERIEPVDLDELDALLEQGAALIDVRERDERDNGYIAGSRNIPYRLLSLSGAEVPTDRPVVTICESGARAGIAASILAAKGIDARPVLEGGLDAWAARGGQMVEFRRCGS